MTIYLVAVMLFGVAMFAALCLIIGPSKRFEMDWGPQRPEGRPDFNFLVTFAIYRRMFYTIFGASLVFLLFMPHEHSGPSAAMLTGAAMYSLLFIGWLTYCYELYCHGKYPKSPPACASNYTGVKYAVTLSLAYSAITLFIIGTIVMLAGMVTP